MPVTKNYLLTIFFVVSILFASAMREKVSQDTIISIKVTETNSHDMRPKYINIYKTSDNTRIIYSRFDSIDTALLKRDNKYAEAQELWKLGKLDTMIALSTRYHTFLHDTLEMKNAELDGLIDVILKTGDKELLRLARDKNIITLDGFSVNFEISTGKTTRKIFTKSPSAATYPELYRFYALLNQIYRQSGKTSYR